MKENILQSVISASLNEYLFLFNNTKVQINPQITKCFVLIDVNEYVNKKCTYSSRASAFNKLICKTKSTFCLIVVIVQSNTISHTVRDFLLVFLNHLFEFLVCFHIGIIIDNVAVQFVYPAGITHNFSVNMF